MPRRRRASLRRKIHRVSGVLVAVLSLIAFAGALDHPQPFQPDDGTAASVLQLSLAALSDAVLIFLFTADWDEPRRRAKELALPAVAVIAAVTMYYLQRHLG
jgi:hypothetical protein